MRTEMQTISCLLAPERNRASSKAHTFFKHPILCLLMLAAMVFCVRGATSPSDPTTAWIPMPFPTNIFSDYIGDQQTGSEEGDIIGATDLNAIYVTFVAGDSPTNGTVGYRIRLGKDASPAGFKGVLHVGMDADNNGSVDLFLSVDIS